MPKTVYTTALLRHVRQSIGHAIREQRTQQNMTLRKLSRLTGISAELLDQYELGKNEIELEEMLRVWCVLR